MFFSLFFNSEYVHMYSFRLPSWTQGYIAKQIWQYYYFFLSLNYMG